MLATSIFSTSLSSVALIEILWLVDQLDLVKVIEFLDKLISEELSESDKVTSNKGSLDKEIFIVLEEPPSLTSSRLVDINISGGASIFNI